MSRTLRKRPRVCYYEPEEPPYDEFVFCTECGDYVYEYCSIHGPLLIIPDEKVPAKTGFPDFVPRAALTIPRVFLHLANSHIKGAGIGVFSTLTLPEGVRFGPYRGVRAASAGDSSYAWQIYDKNHKPSHVIDATDDNASNWMRYVNCSRHISEQNLVAYQYQGQLYYRTIKVIPRFAELLVFYGSEFAATLGVQLRLYSVPCECYGCQPKLPKKTPVNRNKRQARIENKAKEETTHKKNLVGDLQETVAQLRNDLKTNNDASVPSAIVTEKPEKEKCKKKKNGKKSPVVKVQEPPIKSTNTSVASVHEKNKIVTKVPVNETNLKAAVFKCDKCGKMFDVKSNLEKHIHTHTSSINGTDGQKYSSAEETNFKFHERTHTGEKPYKCSYCNKLFSCKSHMTEHERIHTGEKPYKCSHCNKSFTHKSTMILHEKIHTGEKPYKCQFCGKLFTQQIDMTRHERTHTGEKPYKCSYCNKLFSCKSHMTEHERIHTGEKPYKCSHCNKLFSCKSNMTTHERTHTKEKPYACDICNYRSAQTSTLKCHLIKIHGGVKPYKK